MEPHLTSAAETIFDLFALRGLQTPGMVLQYSYRHTTNN